MGKINELFSKYKNIKANKVNNVDFSLEIKPSISFNSFKNKAIVTMNFIIDKEKHIELPENEYIVVEVKTKSNQNDPYKFIIVDLSRDSALEIPCNQDDFDDDSIKLKVRVSYRKKEVSVTESYFIVQHDGTQKVKDSNKIFCEKIISQRVIEVSQLITYLDEEVESGNW